MSLFILGNLTNRHWKRVWIEESRILSALQAIAMDPRNHKHLVNCYLLLLEKAKLVLSTVDKLGQTLRMCT